MYLTLLATTTLVFWMLARASGKYDKTKFSFADKGLTILEVIVSEKHPKGSFTRPITEADFSLA